MPQNPPIKFFVKLYLLEEPKEIWNKRFFIDEKMSPLSQFLRNPLILLSTHTPILNWEMVKIIWNLILRGTFMIQGSSHKDVWKPHPPFLLNTPLNKLQRSSSLDSWKDTFLHQYETGCNLEDLSPLKEETT